MCNCGGGGRPALPSIQQFRPQNPNRLPVPGEVSFTFNIPNVQGTTSYVGPSGKRYNVAHGQTWLLKAMDAEYFASLGFGSIVGATENLQTPQAPAGGEFEPLSEL